MAEKKGRRAMRSSPPLASPDVLAKLQTAADAAGCSLQELADLVFEAGIAPKREPDGVTLSYTLKDLGEKLFGTMRDVSPTARAAWFAGLAPTQKTAIIVVLRDQGYRTEVIARELAVAPVDVVRTWNAYAGQLGAQVVGIRLDTIAGQLQMAAEKAQQIALQNGDARVFWTVEKDKIAVLQSLGIVDAAIRRVEVTHKLDDEQKQEMLKLADLQAKKEKRRLEVQELKQIETSGDPIPSEVEDADYDEDEDEED